MDMLGDLESLQFEYGIQEEDRSWLYLQGRSRGLMIKACAHATFFCKLLCNLRESFHEKQTSSCLLTALLTGIRDDDELKVGIIGGGHLGKQLARVLLQLVPIPAENLRISTRRPEALDEFQKLGIQCFYHNPYLVDWANVIFLCCLPSQLPNICLEIQTRLEKGCIVYSFVAAVPIARLKLLLNHTNILRPQYHCVEDFVNIWGANKDITAALRDPVILRATCPYSPAENEDLENTKVTSVVASASDPEPRSSPYRPQMVSPMSENAPEDRRKTAAASEAQALVGQEVLPADQAPVLNKMAKYQVPQRSGDIVMIQSEHTGAIDILSADLESADLLGDHRKVSPPLMAPPCIWTFAKMKEFKSKLGKEKNSRLVVKRGEVVTIRVPTHPEGKRVCWEFATDDYDIGFGVYFDWTPVTSTDITVQVSDSSEDEDEDEEEEEEMEDPVPVGDVERGSRSSLRGRYGEVMPVYRRDSHRDVQAGSHDYPGEGIYLLKFDNSYSLLRNKTLYFHIYYTS
ncbi:protein TMED8 isoform X1 [Ailuropoda melanoleuca]|uniref:protein TMED8 isoform X1 n=2 Tax=Ailuropoda melanoleuca TaxID=9646 RepID=UPI001494B779|nr:protein TMED8 isoform X1 [Ailuropoda melanoleuca]